MFFRATGASGSRWSFVESVHAALAVAVFALLAGPVLSAAAQNVIRVEEDWELVLGTPDPASDAPQVTCVISPLGHINSYYAALDVNHQSLPAFVPGGLQLQLWNGETNLDSRKFPTSAVMMTQGETVAWMQTMKLTGTTLWFEVTGGNSTSFGSFGGQGYLKTSAVTTLANLNSYDPAVSVQHSGVGYASHRVQSLVLKAVRVYTATGQLYEDTTPRVVQ